MTAPGVHLAPARWGPKANNPNGLLEILEGICGNSS